MGFSTPGSSVLHSTGSEVKWSRSVMSNSATPWTEAYRLLCPWDFPGKNVGVGCHFLLQEIFPTQGLNLDLPYCRQTLYHLSHQGSQNYLPVCSNLCTLSRWCNVTISSSATLFFCLQTFPSFRVFPKSVQSFWQYLSKLKYTGLFPPWIPVSFTSRNLSYIILHNLPKKCALESFFL